MIRRYMAPLKATLMLSDGIVAVVLFLLLVSVRVDVLEGTWTLGDIEPVHLALAYGVMWVGALWFFGLYRLRTHWTLRGEVVDILRAAILLLFVSITVLYVFKLTNISRLFLAMMFVAHPSVTVMTRVALRRLLEWLRSRGRIGRNMLVIGAGPEAELFANTVEGHSELGLRVVGHLGVAGAATPSVSRKVVGTIDEIEDVLHREVIDEVAVCLSPGDWQFVEPVTRICEEEGKIVRVSIQSLGGVLAGGTFEEVGGVPIVTYLYGPDRFLGMTVKRLFDVAVSGASLILLGPVMLAVALYVLIADGRPVLFGQQRVGLHGRPFTCLKFRTMVRDAEEQFPEIAHLSEVRGPAFKIADDPRMTRAGRRLRRASLDELPQLWNVLRGDMSIVGPRPAPPREVDLYSVWHRRRLSMRPGLTGLWQISARNDPDFNRRVSLDLDYIDRWSLMMDVKIMLRTIPAVVRQEGR